MAAPQPPPPPRGGGLSLYANLHDPNDPSPASATISSAPVLYGQDGNTTTSASSVPKKPMDPSLLRFQPTRRPQPATKQSRPKATFPKAIPKTTTTAAAVGPAIASAAAATTDPVTAAPTSDNTPTPAPTTKSTLADWAATEDDEWLYHTSEKRQRGGRKAKKKRLQQQQQQQMETDWDDIYDPSRPTNVDEYLRSDEKVDEVREWKGLLYRHRKGNKPMAADSDMSSDEEDARHNVRPSNQFAPPPAYAAVPPPPAQSPPRSTPAAPPPPSTTGDDAYAHRLAMSTSQPPPPPEPHSQSQSSSTTISAAPILYNTQPPPPPSPPSPTASPSDNDDTELNTSRPGQAGFAHRLMSKYGWTHGSGLGADESGIINPLRVQVEKRKKRSDADGGGWAEPAGKGKIIGGRRPNNNSNNNNNNASQSNTNATSSGGAGPSDVHGGDEGLSDVIVLLNMLDNMPDLAAEVEDGLGQEIGEECGEKYGRVERVFIDTLTQRVFIKFTEQISALRAVNELQGRVFNGNTITPKFYNSEAFEQGVYIK